MSWDQGSWFVGQLFCTDRASAAGGLPGRAI